MAIRQGPSLTAPQSLSLFPGRGEVNAPLIAVDKNGRVEDFGIRVDVFKKNREPSVDVLSHVLTFNRKGLE